MEMKENRLAARSNLLCSNPHPPLPHQKNGDHEIQLILERIRGMVKRKGRVRKKDLWADPARSSSPFQFHHHMVLVTHSINLTNALNTPFQTRHLVEDYFIRHTRILESGYHQEFQPSLR
jgi:hypothetical protein